MMNKMYKKIAILMAALTLTTAAAAPAFANDGQNTIEFSVNQISSYKTVIVDSATIRSEPSVNGRSLGEYKYGTQVYCDGITNNGWYSLIVSDPVYGGERAGYIRGDLLGDSYSGTGYTTHVNTGYLALRNAPSAEDSNIIGQLWNGSRVEIIGNNVNGYVYVKVTYCAPGEWGNNVTGYTGYVNASYLF